MEKQSVLGKEQAHQNAMDLLLDQWAPNARGFEKQGHKSKTQGPAVSVVLAVHLTAALHCQSSARASETARVLV